MYIFFLKSNQREINETPRGWRPCTNGASTKIIMPSSSHAYFYPQKTTETSWNHHIALESNYTTIPKNRAWNPEGKKICLQNLSVPLFPSTPPNSQRNQLPNCTNPTLFSLLLHATKTRHNDITKNSIQHACNALNGLHEKAIFQVKLTIRIRKQIPRKAEKENI